MQDVETTFHLVIKLCVIPVLRIGINLEETQVTLELDNQKVHYQVKKKLFVRAVRQLFLDLEVHWSNYAKNVNQIKYFSFSVG